MQPEPWAAPSGWRSPGSSSSVRPSCRRSVASSRCPPVTRTAPGPAGGSPPRAGGRHRAGGVAGQHAGLGQVRGDHRRPRQDQGDERHLGVGLEQPRAGLGHHHRVHDDRGPGGRRSSASATARVVTRRSEHADLDGVDAEVLDDRAHLRDHHRRATRPRRPRPRRVLRGDGRDRGGAVDARSRERLEVGLDAGSAAGVRAGDGQADRHAVGTARRGGAGPGTVLRPPARACAASPCGPSAGRGGAEDEELVGGREVRPPAERPPAPRPGRRAPRTA